jgi:hypothetical protein
MVWALVGGTGVLVIVRQSDGDHQPGRSLARDYRAGTAGSALPLTLPLLQRRTPSHQGTWPRTRHGNREGSS